MTRSTSFEFKEAANYRRFRVGELLRHALSDVFLRRELRDPDLEGAARIVEGVLGQLGLEGEGESADESVSFKFNTCLGACAQAPLMSIDHHLMGHVTPESAVESVGRLQQQSKAKKRRCTLTHLKNLKHLLLGSHGLDGIMSPLDMAAGRRPR